jgi:C4-dicarboxylate transporter DctM subunit
VHSGILIGLGLFFLGIVTGLPLSWVFLGSSLATLLLLGGSTTFMAGTFYHAIDSYMLMAISFFIFAGGLLSTSGIADRIVRLSYAVVGWLKGGLVDVGIFASVIMGALTGSALPVIGALIPLLVPRLERYGYERRYTAAVLVSSSYLGYLIPPSVPGLMYCLFAQQSVAAMFLATAIPGLIVAAGYMILNSFICHRYIRPSHDTHPLPRKFGEYVSEVGRSTWSALPALGCPFVVLVGIYAGVFTPNEAGAIAVVYVAAVGFFVYREMTFRDIRGSVQSTLVTMGMYAVLLGFGTVFTRLLIREGFGEAMTDFILNITRNKYVILLLINTLLLIMGMFIDVIPILIISVPLLVPIAQALGINLVHLGSIMVFNCGIAMTSPPYALSLLVGTRLAEVSYSEILGAVFIYLLLVSIPVLFLVTYVPWLSLWLPTLILGPQVVGMW